MLCGGEVEVAGGADGWSGEGFAFGEAVGDFVADDSAEIGVGLFFLFAVAMIGGADVTNRSGFHEDSIKKSVLSVVTLRYPQKEMMNHEL